MKGLVKKSSWLAWAISVALVVTTSVPAGAQSPTVKVPAGTTLVVTTGMAISPATVRPGDAVQLTVANDVVVGGKVVVKAGASARGEVTRAESRGIAGKPDKITIAIQNVTAVDGSVIPVAGTKMAEGEDKVVMTIVLTLICLPFIFAKGGEASIPSGASINVLTNGVAEVKVSGDLPSESER